MKNKLCLGALLAASCLSLPAMAETTVLGADVSANVGFVSQYAFRGLMQSDEQMALQGGLDVTHSSGLYAGVWGSTVDFNDNDQAQLEVDLYGGYGGTYEGLDYALGVIYYAYPGADTAREYDFYELTASVGYDFGLFSSGASVNFSPDFFNESDDAWYYALSAEVPLPYDFSLSGHVGYQDIENEVAFGFEDYTDWSIGIGYTYADIDLSATYVDTSLDEPRECADGCEARVIFGITYSF